MTVELWVWPEGATTNKGRCSLVTKSSESWDAGWGVVCERDATELLFFLCPGRGRVLRLCSKLTPLAWTHIAATYDGLCARLYSNGALVGEASAGPDPVAIDFAGSSDLHVGVSQFGKHRIGFVGMISELRCAPSSLSLVFFNKCAVSFISL